MILAFVLAFFSYTVVEKPCMNFGRKLSDRIRNRKISQAVAPVEILVGKVEA